MLNYTEYEIKTEGKREIRLILPCFYGEKSEFYHAKRMNSFYSTAADRIYEYALSFSPEDVRRMSFLCFTCVDAEESAITVTLDLSLRRIMYAGSCPTLRKQLVHSWKNGVLLWYKKV